MKIDYRARRRFKSSFISSFIVVSMWLIGCSHTVEKPALHASGHEVAGHASEHHEHAFHDHDHGTGAAGPVLKGWFKDDYEAARAAAEKANVPLVVDIWAKWCSPCIDMHRRVSRHPNVVRYENRFVWLMLDTDADENRFPFHMFKTDRWPTYLIVNPLDEREIARLEGAQAISRFVSFLESGQKAFEASAAATDSARERFDAIRSAKRAAFQGDFESAAECYEAAVELETLPSRRAMLLKSQIESLTEGRELGDCLDAAEHVIDSPILSSVELDIIEMGIACSRQDGDVDHDFFEAAGAYLETHDSAEPTERSRRLGLLRTLYVVSGNRGKAHDVAVVHREFLDEVVSKTASEHEALKWDRSRAEVYLFLDEPKKLRSVFEHRAKVIPEEFEPHANLAWLALKLGDLETAATSARMAVSLAPDPQRGEVLSLFAEIVHTKGDRKTEGEVRRFLVEYYENLPPVLAPPGALKRAKGALSVFEQSSL